MRGAGALAGAPAGPLGPRSHEPRSASYHEHRPWDFEGDSSGRHENAQRDEGNGVLPGGDKAAETRRKSSGSSKSNMQYSDRVGLGSPDAGDKIEDISPPKFIKRVFGIGPEHPDLQGMPPSRLIYPLSPFGISWVVITAVLLLYTAVVTPAVIVFHWLDEPCYPIPTLPIDVFLDIFFLLDIGINFSTGMLVGHRYIDEWKPVFNLYLRGGFSFDLVTSFPVSFFELDIQRQCAISDGSMTAVENGQLRFIRVVKPLRWFKLVRIMKLGKLGHISNALMDYFNISPRTGRAVKVMCSLLGFIHVVGCLMWLVKVLLEGEGVSEFLANRTWLNDNYASLSTTKGKIDAYIVCVYFVTVVTTTVGFGDIVAESSEERVAFIVLMILSAFVWGTLLAQVSEIHRAATFRDQEKLMQVSTAVDFLTENDVPRHLRQRIVNWERFTAENGKAQLAQREMLERLPHRLQRELVLFLHAGTLKKVPVFHFLAMLLSKIADDDELDGTFCYEDNEFSEKFLAELYMRLDYQIYEAGSDIVSFGSTADRVIILVSGRATVIFDETEDAEDEPIEIGAGDYLGDLAILGDSSWGSSSLISAPFHDIRVRSSPYEFVVTLELTKSDFQKCLSGQSLVIQAAMDRWNRTLYQAIRERGKDHAKGQSRSKDVLTYLHVAFRWDIVVTKMINMCHTKDTTEIHRKLSVFSEVVRGHCFRRTMVSGAPELCHRAEREDFRSMDTTDNGVSLKIDENGNLVEGKRQNATECPKIGACQNESFLNELTIAAAKTEELLLGKLDRINSALQENISATNQRLLQLETRLEQMAVSQIEILNLFSKSDHA